MDRTSLKALGRAGLQRIAKAKGVRAVGPSSKIIDRLLECVKGNSTVSDETSVLEERGLGVLKDVKNSVILNGEQSDATKGTQKSKRRVAFADNRIETIDHDERLEVQGTKGTKALRENTVVVPPTTRILSPDELKAIQGMLLFQDILPPTADSGKPPATSNTKRKRDGAGPEEQALAKASSSKQSQKRRKTEQS